VIPPQYYISYLSLHKSIPEIWTSYVLTISCLPRDNRRELLQCF